MCVLDTAHAIINTAQLISLLLVILMHKTFNTNIEVKHLCIDKEKQQSALQDRQEDKLEGNQSLNCLIVVDANGLDTMGWEKK